MERLLGIGAAAKALGVSIATLRRWEETGRVQAEHTVGGHRRYDLARIRTELVRADKPASRRTVAYGCVSAAAPKADLERQRLLLETYCARQGWTVETILDRSSGIDYHKTGLRRLIRWLVRGQVGRLVITRKDRLLRLGAELVFAVCEVRNVEVVILNQDDGEDFEEDLVRDVKEILAVFSARLYGNRSHRAGRLLEALQQAVDACSVGCADR
ncbi:MAG: IS607 family transposase [Alphaproteobacteria bacterium]|nr:IS607 family transposase [Alphaproteobacteria bacterium]